MRQDAFDVVAAGPDRWIPRGALATGTPEQVFVANNILPGSAPSIIFEVENTQGFIELVFPQGAEIGALLIEPANVPSTLVLDSTARGSGVLTNDTCLREQEKLDRLLAALPQSAPPPRSFTPPPPPGPPPPPVSSTAAMMAVRRLGGFRTEDSSELRNAVPALFSPLVNLGPRQMGASAGASCRCSAALWRRKNEGGGVTEAR